MIAYILDTNICIYIIKKSPPKVFARFSRLNLGDVGISAITYAELQFGVSNSSDPQRNQDTLNEFLSPLEILDFPSGAGPLYGEVRSKLKKVRTPMGPLDLLIGVHALFLGLVLVTNNTKEFKNIPRLKLQNWT